MKKIYRRPTLRALEVSSNSFLTASGDEPQGYGDPISTEDAPDVISNSSGPWQ